MTKYLAQANYASDGVKGILKECGSGRHTGVEKLIESVGAKVEAFYYAFGNTDLYIIVDGPDNVTVLLTPEEIDAATKKSLLDRPPGQ